MIGVPHADFGEGVMAVVVRAPRRAPDRGGGSFRAERSPREVQSAEARGRSRTCCRATRWARSRRRPCAKPTRTFSDRGGLAGHCERPPGRKSRGEAIQRPASMPRFDGDHHRGARQGVERRPRRDRKSILLASRRAPPATSPKPEFSLLSPANRGTRATPRSGLRNESAEYQSLAMNFSCNG